MQAISLERSSFAQTAVVSLLTLAALASLGLALALPEQRAAAAPATPPVDK